MKRSAAPAARKAARKTRALRNIPPKAVPPAPEIQEGTGGRGAARDDRVKRLLKRNPKRDEPINVVGRQHAGVVGGRRRRLLREEKPVGVILDGIESALNRRKPTRRRRG